MSSMATNLRSDGETAKQPRASGCRTAATVRQQETRRQRHTAQLAQRAIREAGTPTRVGHAIGRSLSTASHYATDKVHPEFRDAFTVLLNLSQHPGVSGRAYAEAVSEAVELDEIVPAEAETLVARGLYLLEEENRRDSVEDDASMVSPPEHAAALRAHRDAASELAAILDELWFREIDLHALYRARRNA